MIKRLCVIFLLVLSQPVRADVSLRTVDFLEPLNITTNAAGPLLVRMDEVRNHLVVANTLSSSLTVIDGESHRVTNIPIGGRALQHLKAEAMTISRKTGDVYLIGTNCVHIISPQSMTARTISTGVQFESIAVDEETGNVFVAGRESKALGFIKASSKKIKMKKWLDHCEDLINLNATPPPPIRKVVFDNALGQLIAVDGLTSTLYLFDAESQKPVASRTLPIASGGRWHYGGYNESTHCLYLVTETDKRTVIEAAKIDVASATDWVVALPEYTEGVGIIYNAARDEIYIPYDNHPSVHVVSFEEGGRLEEIKIPAYGNDASAIDTKNNILYISSWAFGEIDVIDLETRSLKKRITGLGIIPHMFTMAYNPNNHMVYFPKGATAVNGTFGAAVTVLDPATEQTQKIYTGWAPIDLIELENRNCVLVFNSEDQFAAVQNDGTYDTHTIPYDYPVRSEYSPEGNVYLSYGPHQSYWPTVYIWDAKNGILTINKKDMSFYDRRIPRQAHAMAMDQKGILYFTQNNWGKEEQFLGVLTDEVRVYESNGRLTLGDEVEREITQRILDYDPAMNRFYLVRVGEKDDDPSILQIIDPAGKKVLGKITLGQTATDLVFDDESIYVANFDARSVSVIDKENFDVREIETDEHPLRLCRFKDDIYVLNHASNSLQRVLRKRKTFKIPYKGLPDNLFAWGEAIIITSYQKDRLAVIEFDPQKSSFKRLHEQTYPYGETRLDGRNVSFYVRGQFGDAIFCLTRGIRDSHGKLWITDFLSGKLYILQRN